MFKNLKKEELFLMFVSFFAAVMLSRLFIYFYARAHSVGPEIFVDETHIHHYIIGALFILISTSAYYLFNLKRGFFHLVLLGTGIGLLCDEFSFWSLFRSNN